MRGEVSVSPCRKDEVLALLTWGDSNNGLRNRLMIDETGHLVRDLRDHRAPARIFVVSSGGTPRLFNSVAVVRRRS